MRKKAAKLLDPPAKPSRGRPPKPGGRAPQAEVQRAYRARLKAVGEGVRVVDTRAGRASAIPGFDPARDTVVDRAVIANLQDELYNALLKRDLLEDELARVRDRNAGLERELKRLEREITNSVKARVVLEQKLAKKPRQ